MEVYHASTVVVDRPDTTHSRSFLDFGPGFYVTTILDQAQKYGARFSRRGKMLYSISTNWLMISANGKLLNSNVTMKHGLIS